MSLIRIVNVDYYMSPPIQGLDIMYSEFRGTSVNHVPVIRIFGSTNTGKKICLHVHGVFPYIYIPYDGNENLDSFMYQTATALDKALNVLLGQTSSNAQHVYKVVLVSGRPFYGYHPKEHQFLKLHFYNPSMIKKAINLLENGSIMNKIFQPHEAHLPYTLQFMIDYNLHGMSFIKLSEIRFRINPNNPQNDINPELFLPASISKISSCELEADAIADHILNRLEIKYGNPGIQALWDDEKQRRRKKNESSQISQCLSQTKRNCGVTASELLLKQTLKDKLENIPENSVSTDSNISVYPAETPDSEDLNASYVFDSQNSVDSTVVESRFDPEKMLDLLCELVEQEAVEEGSILSQIANNPEDSDEEAQVDLSLPLIPTDCIPQLDGNSDDFKAIPGLDMPVLENVDYTRECFIIPNGKSSKIKVKKPDKKKLKSSSQTIKTHLKTLKKHLNRTDLLALVSAIKKECLLKRIKKSNKATFRTTPRSSRLATVTSPDHTYEIEISPVTEVSYEEISNCSLFPILQEVTETQKYPLIDLDLSQFSDYCTRRNCSTIKRKIRQFIGNSTEINLDEIRAKLKHFSCSVENLFNLEPPKINRKKRLAESNTIRELDEHLNKLSSNAVNITGTESSKQTCLEKRRYTKIYKRLALKQVQGLDGANDSSSSEDDFVVDFGGKNRYSPLFVDQSSTGNSGAAKRQYSKIKLKSTSANFNLEETLVEEDLVCRLQGKRRRRLTFENVTDAKEFSEAQLSQKAGPSFTDNCLAESNENSKHFETSYIWKPKCDPPTRAEITANLKQFGIPEMRHKQPFYSNPEDVTGPIEIGNAILKVTSNTSVHYPDFESNFNTIPQKPSPIKTNNLVVITPAKEPPTRKHVEEWLKQNAEIKPKPLTTDVKKIKIKIPHSQDDEMSDDSLSISSCSPESSLQSSPILGKTSRKKKSAPINQSKLRKSVIESQFLTNDCQISAATLNNTHGFKLSLENLQDALALNEHQHLLTLIMELHVQTRGDFKPDPQLDPIRAIFYGFIYDSPESGLNNATGVFVVNSLHGKPCEILKGTGISSNTICIDSEVDLINEFVKFLQKSDPDVLTGYEIEMVSWGYLIERGYTLGLNLPPLLSRIPKTKSEKSQKFSDEFHLPGRIILDMWRLLRHEIALQSYTFENIVYHILHKRVPMFNYKQLSFWWEHKTSLYRHKTFDYYLLRIKFIISLIEQLDLIGRTSELARLFGIQFFEVLSRGSQFRVESMMLRLAKPLNYIPVTPSVSQRAKMRAPEFLPLILEPESKFYSDPVIVLDFQSLYPSMIIAYNYCFSTCVGRVEHLGKTTPFEFGATVLKISPNLISKLLHKDKLNYSPCGVAFVKPEVRQGILPKMLEEILNTRLMVKKSMKQNKSNKTLQRVLHSRQLGLKLIANVTYGYTAANFSGRMPCVEIGDSVVSKGRETLQRAIDLVDQTPEWGGKVVYGDTDSLFVHLPGKSRSDAFRIGSEIAEAVTNANPSPVKLKLEKVYQPCILQTKKRYVGYMYESAEQTAPQFDAKGIETVRRDGCPAASKMLEKSLKMLFDHCDVSLIKQYVLRQFTKILMGRVSIQDLTFAKEYRGMAGYRPGACVPALELTKKWIATDRRNEPRTGQRVPYVIVNGPPGLPLIRLVRSPYDLLGTESGLRPNALYYITRVIIPPINRCFNIIGVDLNVWFNAMPRKQFQYLPKTSPTKKTTISQFFMTTSCAVCGQQSQKGICEKCVLQPQTSIAILHEKVRVWELHSNEINLICNSCTGDNLSDSCVSLDCPVFYQRHQAAVDLQQSDFVRQIVREYF